MRYKKRKRYTDIEEKPVSLSTRILVILFILLALYLLFRFGGNGQDWYRGKPIHLR